MQMNDAYEFAEIEIGTEFWTTATYKWRCTDKGTRVIVAVRIVDGYPAPHHHPPFADAVEHVFDEYAIGGCFREPLAD
ncbi:hypothetical protein [Caballeronia sp. dw_19]|uniref:hypothetical protein n=1 Tax=Caballeronia sp. dw_19 TaxID=2719791 RepID=UPI001BD6DF82|nr:hypothetical protein [Caballeronia sp. dw_19]